MDPGPIDPSLLRHQERHRSQLALDPRYEVNSMCPYTSSLPKLYLHSFTNVDHPLAQDTIVLKCRRREATLRRGPQEVPLDPRIIPLLQESGFLGLSRLRFVQYDWHLLTALVERWRPETHTFHMPHGEMTVTLEDVAVQLGLPIDGDCVIGSTNYDWAELCERLLGVRPSSSDSRGGRLKLVWLAAHFAEIPELATEEEIKRHARAYILQLLGGILFADKSSNLVHLMFLPLLESFTVAGTLSWGSACLAWLYRQLCVAADKDASEIGGPLILLQVWAWDRFPHISPSRRTRILEPTRPLAWRWGSSSNRTTTQVSTHTLIRIRDAIDRQTPEQVK